MLASMVAAIHVEDYCLSAISMSMDSRPPELGPVAWVPLSVGAPSACSTGGENLFIRMPREREKESHSSPDEPMSRPGRVPLVFPLNLQSPPTRPPRLRPLSSTTPRWFTQP